MKVCLGGTFDIIHEGHILLLRKAFEIGKKVYIGLSTDELVKKLGKEAKPYEERKKKLEDFLIRMGWNAIIEPLNDVYGTAIKEDFDAIIVSPETERRAIEINEIRRRSGLKELKIIKIPYLFANDGIAVSTSRIKSGEIKGLKRIRPMKVCIGSKNEIKIRAVKEVFNEFFEEIEIEYESMEIITKKQPIGKEIIEGAIKRAKEACKNFDYGVGIEAGIKEENGVYFVEQYVAIIDKLGYITFGKSPAFQCPDWIIEKLDGKEMKEIIPFRSNEEKKKGAIWFLSHKMDRLEITKIAILMALLARKNF